MGFHGDLVEFNRDFVGLHLIFAGGHGDIIEYHGDV